MKTKMMMLIGAMLMLIALGLALNGCGPGPGQNGDGGNSPIAGLEAPTNLMVEVIDATIVKLEWFQNSTTPVIGNIEMSTTASVNGFALLQNGRVSTGSYRHIIGDPLVPGKKFWFRVRDEAKQSYRGETVYSGYSNIFEVKLPEVKLVPPTNLRIVPSTKMCPPNSVAIKLAWTKSASVGDNGYTIGSCPDVGLSTCNWYQVFNRYPSMLEKTTESEDICYTAYAGTRYIRFRVLVGLNLVYQGGRILTPDPSVQESTPSNEARWTH